MTLFMFSHMSLLLFFHYNDVMFDSYMANMANDEGIDVCNLLYVSWVGEIFLELGLSTLGMNHFILCISCIEKNLGHHMVATWRFIDEDGYLNFQLEAIIEILERQLWSWTCMKHCERWEGLPHKDVIWREDVCCSIHLL